MEEVIAQAFAITKPGKVLLHKAIRRWSQAFRHTTAKSLDKEIDARCRCKAALNGDATTISGRLRRDEIWLNRHRASGF
ncbi:hypothetical protein [Bradyrhizobium sp. Tv2a-2]|uniref:hypothetical protein n=1 Tax=Bradyrhizobium sp. Tv2a-2 TaxID=113395 RepID=UPI0012EB141B|nr:hypothetical protein [Bradyrhizobium sp. Tv2a-2]